MRKSYGVYAMQALIISRGFIPRIHSTGIFEDWQMILHTDEQRRSLIRHGFSAHRLHVSNVPEGILSVPAQRAWGEKNLTEVDDWYMAMDDNVRGFTAVPKEYWDFPVREDFECECEDPYALMESLVTKCEEKGTTYGGLATSNNWYFRQTHYRFYSRVITCCAVVKHCEIPWDPPDVVTSEDVARTFETIARYGCVVVDNFGRYVKPHGEEGGLGPYSERPNKKLFQLMIDRYPGLVRLHHSSGYAVSRFYNQKSIDKWRKENGYL